jgi:hypothetical protein
VFDDDQRFGERVIDGSRPSSRFAITTPANAAEPSASKANSTIRARLIPRRRRAVR